MTTHIQIETGNIIPFQKWYGGQFIVILPVLEMVVVVSNTFSGVPDATYGEQWDQTMDVIVNYVIPAAEYRL